MAEIEPISDEGLTHLRHSQPSNAGMAIRSLIARLDGAEAEIERMERKIERLEAQTATDPDYLGTIENQAQTIEKLRDILADIASRYCWSDHGESHNHTPTKPGCVVCVARMVLMDDEAPTALASLSDHVKGEG